MKIAIATDGNQVSAHFGHCDLYTLFDVADDMVKNREVVENPGHQPGYLPKFLRDQGVEKILAGGMGQKARALFDKFGIQAVVGISGEINSVIDKYLSGTLESQDNSCNHDHNHHECGEH